MKYEVSRVDGKGKKTKVTTVYADGYRTYTIEDNVIPWTIFTFYAITKHWFRDDEENKTTTLTLSGDILVEQVLDLIGDNE